MIRRFPVFLFFAAILFAVFSPEAQGQCKAFARRICKVDLERYMHDGNYHAAILTEGEEAELYKTFYADQEYRIAICGDDGLPDIQFRVMDIQRNVLYDNSENEFRGTWDFRLEASQQLMIWVKVSSPNPGREPASGCVSILFGLSTR
ncbi:MAG: hypothetical protein EA408_01715 [Marinilabiliales bacterium]|nr:MAG: hypothetical protein EA408_01715 [Marinilabiliales bacterium]